MFLIDQLILIAGILLLFGTASSTFSGRVGVPVLIAFITIGMLAGSEGIGGLAFENYTLAHAIGTLALAVILFDGGLRTSTASIRQVARPALTLATVGVMLTAGITGAAASVLLGLPPLQGFLLGSIIGSTDAAAVFLVLRGRGMHLQPRVASTLEVESGSNDPMAIFLTIGTLQVLTGEAALGWELALLFVRQMGLGLVFGVIIGRVAAQLTNRIPLEAAGLYPVLISAFALFAFGSTAMLGGSGFLAVYVAGIVLGNSTIVFKRGVLLFFDGVAWLAQIVMFTMLGLLSFPSRLLEVAGPALLIAFVLTFIARPLASWLLLMPFKYRQNEIAFVAWGGLKGAVPIILAIFPLLAGVPSGPLIFDVVFFVVLISTLLQGWTLPSLAGRLGLQVEAEPEPPVTLEITSLRNVDSDIVSYSVTPDSRAADRLLRQLALPEGAVIAMIARGTEMIAPRGSTRIRAGDHVFVVLRPAIRALVDRIFASATAAAPPLPAAEFPLLADATAGEVAEFYGVQLPGDPNRTLRDLLLDELGAEAAHAGRRLECGDVALRVAAMENGRIEQVAIVVILERAQ